MAWTRLWDLARQTAVVPCTRVALEPPASALGPTVDFTARTSLGPVGFEDRMRVVAWHPPGGERAGRAVVVKTGRVLGGRIDVRVVRRDGGSRVTWQQRVLLPWLPERLQPVTRVLAPALAPGYRFVLRQLLG